MTSRRQTSSSVPAGVVDQAKAVPGGTEADYMNIGGGLNITKGVFDLVQSVEKAESDAKPIIDAITPLLQDHSLTISTRLGALGTIHIGQLFVSLFILFYFLYGNK